MLSQCLSFADCLGSSRSISAPAPAWCPLALLLRRLPALPLSSLAPCFVTKDGFAAWLSPVGLLAQLLVPLA